ncbi:MAG TPA: hypothetical protein VHG71_02085 [Verrucomicrobiae bacterium]|nr:hypothetical protein [Verrucomicrobiae bacterium]
MTEIEAQKFIVRHAPILLRYETTEAKIRRIRSQFIVHFIQGIFSILLSFIGGWPVHSRFNLFIRIILLILGFALISFGFWMRQLLLEACRTISFSQSQIINPKS